MAEWFKAAVLKTASPKGDVGSNPTPSAKFCMQNLARSRHFVKQNGRSARKFAKKFHSNFWLITFDLDF
jgi:hypothetical protein